MINNFIFCPLILMLLAACKSDEQTSYVANSNSEILVLLSVQNSGHTSAHLGFSSQFYVDGLHASIIDKMQNPELPKDTMLGIAYRCSMFRDNVPDNTMLAEHISSFLADNDSAVGILRSLGWTCEPLEKGSLDGVLEGSRHSVKLLINGRAISHDLYIRRSNQVTQTEYFCVSPETREFGKYDIFTDSERFVWLLK